MRQSHVTGERIFVDYAGTMLTVIDGLTGEAMTAQLFVAVLGASSLAYAEATCTRVYPTGSARTFMGGIPATVVCDNLRSGLLATEARGRKLHAAGDKEARGEEGAAGGRVRSEPTSVARGHQAHAHPTPLMAKQTLVRSKGR